MSEQDEVNSTESGWMQEGGPFLESEPHAPNAASRQRRSDRRRDRPFNLDRLVWALALMWAGMVLLAARLGLLDGLTPETFDPAWALPFARGAWSLIFLGVGLLVGIEILVRLLVPVYRRNVLGYVILVIVFISLGLSITDLIWPLILIVIGVTLLWRQRART